MVEDEAFAHPASDEEGEGDLGPPPEWPAWPAVGVVPLKRLRVEGNSTGAAEAAVTVKRPRLTEGAVAVNPQMPHFDLLQPDEGGNTQEPGEGELGAPPEPPLAADLGLFGSEDWDCTEEGYPVSQAYSEWEPTLMDVSIATEESRLAKGPADSEIAFAKGGVEEPMASKPDGPIVTEEPMPAEGIVEEPVAGQAETEIALAKWGMQEPLAGEADGSIVTKETIPVEGIMQHPVPGKADTEIVSKELRLEEGGLGKPMAGKTNAEITLANRWLALRYPIYPSTGKFEDFMKYNVDSKRIREFNKAGYGRSKNLPTWGVEPDQETKVSVKFEERDVCLKAGESIVAVSSVGPGHGNTCFCSGVIINCDEDGVGTGRILTSSGILYNDRDELRSPEQKVYVKLPNGQKHEGHVLYVNRHYNIAILKVIVGSSIASLGFGGIPRYGQRVIALGRDRIGLVLRDGSVSTLERTVLGRTHYMFLQSAQKKKSFPLICTGGPVIDENGAMVGIIACHVPEASMISVSIVQICLDMWKNHSCIARPKINMSLRTVQMLPIKKKDEVRCIYNIQSGFVIDGVDYDSTPEKIGIRKGDVIEIVDEKCGSTLPELESYLLLHGLRFLRKEGLTLTKELELKIRVNDLVEGSSTDTRLSIPVVYDMALP